MVLLDKVLRLVYNSLIQSHLNYCKYETGYLNYWVFELLFLFKRLCKLSVHCSKNVYALSKIDFYVSYFYDKETGELPSHTKAIFSRNELLTVHIEKEKAKSCKG